jgi:hypothetical protein
LAAVMAIMSSELRRPSEIAVIRAPYDLDNEALADFTRQNLTHDEHDITDESILLDKAENESLSGLQFGALVNLE